MDLAHPPQGIGMLGPPGHVRGRDGRAARMVHAGAELGGLVADPGLARVAARATPAGPWHRRRRSRARRSPSPPDGSRPSSRKAEHRRLVRHAIHAHVDGSDLEDRDIGAPLALVVDEHAQQPRQQRATQLGVVERSRGCWPRMVAGSAGAMPRRAWSSGPMRPWVTTSVRPRPASQVPQRGRRGAAGRADTPGIGRVGQAARQGLVAADARDLLDDVGLDDEVAPMRRHDGHEAHRRPRRTGTAAAADDGHRVPARGGLRRDLDACQERPPARRRRCPRPAAGDTRAGRNGTRTSGGVAGRRCRRHRSRHAHPPRRRMSCGRPVGAQRAPAGAPGPSRSAGWPRSGARSGRPSGGCSPGRRWPTRPRRRVVASATSLSSAAHDPGDAQRAPSGRR